jgi:type II secretory pathway component GspD/PulD (secretin)
MILTGVQKNMYFSGYLGSRICRQFIVMCVASVVLVPASLSAQPGDMKTYTVQNSSAQVLATTIEQVFGKGVKPVVNNASNLIIFTAPTATAEKILKLLERLDRAPKQLAFKFTLVELSAKQNGDIAKLEKNFGAAAVSELIKNARVSVERYTLHTLENKTAILQVGQSKSIQYARTLSTNRDFGTNVQVTAAANDKNEITLNLDFEASKLIASKNPTSLAGRSVKATIKTTIRLTDGKTVLLNSVEQSGSVDGRHLVLLVTGSVVAAPKPKAASTTVYPLKFIVAANASKLVTSVFQNPATKVNVDVRTNSLLVSTSQEQDLKDIKDLLDKLDVDNTKPKK